MKRIITIFVMINVIINGNMYSVDSSDDRYIVNAIEKESDLNQSDVDRVKLLWLGKGLGTMVASAAALSAVGLAGYMGYQVAGSNSAQALAHKALENVLSAELYPLFAKNLGSAGAVIGATSMGFGVYKLLYPRLYSSVVRKINKYIAMCERFSMANTRYVSYADLQEGMKKPYNTIWSEGRCTARVKGCATIIAQGSIAQILLEQIGLDKPEINQLYNIIRDYRDNVQANIYLLGDCRDESNVGLGDKKSRDAFNESIQQAISGFATGASKAGVIYMQAKNVSQHVKNIESMWDVLKKIATDVNSVHQWLKTGR